MIKRKKIMSFICSICMVITLAVSSTMRASAVNYLSNYTTASALKQTFSKDWEKSVLINTYYQGQKAYEGSMFVGFNTFLVDEDYAQYLWCPTGVWHYAKVVNSNGVSKSTPAVKGGSDTGSAQIQHTGSNVKYYAYMGQ
ncbi:MAG: hypothetical protein RR012_03115 [Oscillospiraceae bacterium]